MVVKEVVVIGAGIIGSTVTKSLRAEGKEVTLLDSGNNLNGTAPSGGHLKPSWFAGMSKDDYTPAMDLLEKIWGLSESEFVVRPTGVKTTVYRVDTDLVISTPKTKAIVTGIKLSGDLPEVTYKTHLSVTTVQTRLLVVAAGVWCEELLPEVFNGNKILRKQGASFRLEHNLESEFIQPWAPYKQIVAHQQEPNEIWIGDGSTILESNWTQERTLECLRRCTKAVGGKPEVLRITTGLRPYCKPLVKKDPCLLTKPHPRVWVATGAGKSGTIGAGWVASRIIRS